MDEREKLVEALKEAARARIEADRVWRERLRALNDYYAVHETTLPPAEEKV